MTKFSSLLIMMSVLGVNGMGAHAETREQWFQKTENEIQQLRLVTKGDPSSVSAPILVSPKSEDRNLMQKFLELKRVATSDKIASTMMIHRLRLQQALVELQKGPESPKLTAEVGRLRDLIGVLRYASEKKLMSMPLPSDVKVAQNQGKTQKEWSSLGSAVTARGPDNSEGKEDLGKKAINVAGQSWNTMWASATTAMAENDRASELRLRQRELEEIKKLENMATDYYLNLRWGDKLAEINAKKIRDLYKDAPGIESIEAQEHKK